ncbi:unnamed protein product [Schistosoma mattheei]|uniref:Uncharacterized protein n=1 Tax=Schistosoma mattheei TaxID=31246 RepID=A0A183PK70_9TREM|nr:unnamed protein product [Schistosoma mattheei]
MEVDNVSGITVHEPTQHYTIIFNALVLMTLFNEFNARKIHGQRNVFSGLHRNPLFIIIWFVTFLLQALIIQFGSYAFSTKALELDQWAWCLFFGVGELVWGQVVNTVPNAIIPKCKCRKRKRPTVVGVNENAADEYIKDAIEVGEADEEEDEISPLSLGGANMGIGGRILWIRGVNRIQTQVSPCMRDDGVLRNSRVVVFYLDLYICRYSFQKRKITIFSLRKFSYSFR